MYRELQEEPLTLFLGCSEVEKGPIWPFLVASVVGSFTSASFVHVRVFLPPLARMDSRDATVVNQFS